LDWDQPKKLTFPVGFIGKGNDQLKYKAGWIPIYDGWWVLTIFLTYPPALDCLNCSLISFAPQGMKVRTMFEEGFSIVGGFLGTEIGGWAGATLVAPAAAKLMTFCGLCLGPWGMVVIVAICAIATGWAMMELFKKGGALSYDISERLGNGQTYHSINQLLESF
jgi:hypothetical protein